MKSILNKILIVAGLAFIMPFLSYAAPAPTVTCSPVYSNDLTGKTVTFTAHVQNGSGDSYDYSWDGDDGIDGSIQTLNHIYSTEGQKTVSVTASSTDSSDYLTASCSVEIYVLANLPDYTALCIPSTNRAVIGQNVTWNSNVSGPLAPYSIVWAGTDFNSNDTKPVIAYATSGSKTATMVSFQSRYGEETTTHNAKLTNVACSAPVTVVGEDTHNPAPLSVSGSCSASSGTQYVNATTTWNSALEISGGTAPYLISWTDNEGSIGAGNSVSKLYSATGTKSAYLTVKDNAGQETDIQCGSVSITATSTDTGGGRRSSSRVNVVVKNSTSTLPAQENIDNLAAWLRDNSTSATPVPQNTVALDLENPISSTALAANNNGTSSTSTVASSTDSGLNLAAAAASAGSTAKYIWYIVIALLIAIISSWATLFFIRRKENKKDKIS
jgi:hypothetical protein